MARPVDRPWNRLQRTPVTAAGRYIVRWSTPQKVTAGIGAGGALAASAVNWRLMLGLVVIAGLAAVVAAVLREQAAERQHQVEIHAARAREISTYYAMTPRQFEEAIAYLCQRDGCSTVQLVGGAGDLGADVVATAPDGRRIVIQCKRYGLARKVGSPDLQRFGGTCYSVHRAQIAVVVTTSTFTRQAVEYAVGQGMRLCDNDWLAGWASQTGPAPWS